jgi:aryl-alcohol dehydrogenase-like predicted oxidoreductase
MSVPMEEQLLALGRAIDAGKIRYIGLSNETPYGLMKFLQLSRDSQLHSKILTVQNSYNLLCRNFDAGLAECCHHERINLLAYSPMAMGILSGKYYSSDDGGPPDARMNLFKGLNSEVAHTTCIFISVLHHSIIIVPPAFQGDTLRVNPDIIFRTPK